jgi:hypothetical protein
MYGAAIPEKDRLTKLTTTASDDFCRGPLWLDATSESNVLYYYYCCCCYSHTHASPHALTQDEFVRKLLVKPPTGPRCADARRRAERRAAEPLTCTADEIGAALITLQLLEDRITALN